MRIVRLRIANFRCIKYAEIFPGHHSVLLGPNNVGKTAILEALNLLLNPELSSRGDIIDENDFYHREYRLTSSANGTSAVNLQGEPTPGEQGQHEDDGQEDQHETEPSSAPLNIRIEAVISDLTAEDEDAFRDHLVPWKDDSRNVVEAATEGEDPFREARTAIRVVFEGWYDEDEDAFDCLSFFLPSVDLPREECAFFHRTHKRHVGFLIYRDFRALTRPITLDPAQLFSRLLRSQDVAPRDFDEVFPHVARALDNLSQDPEMASLLNSYKAELERFLPLSASGHSALFMRLSDLTRREVKRQSQLHVHDELALPLQKMGAGTRSLAILAMLTLITRRRKGGILALEEPETFLFPHAQRRVIDECIALSDQTFVTTHSPYVLERIPIEGVGRLRAEEGGTISWTPLGTGSIKQVNLYAKRLRQSLCEALLGRGVLVVEGDSDRWWLNGVSRILNRQEWRNQRQEALELQGVAVVSAETNGDVLKVGRFFHDAHLRVVGLFDKTDDAGLLAQIQLAPFPCLLLLQAGLEEILAYQLPQRILESVLTIAPHSKGPSKTTAEVSAMSEEEIRDAAKEHFMHNKGSGAMHEWVLSQLDVTALPHTLCDIVHLTTEHMKVGIGTCSLT